MFLPEIIPFCKTEPLTKAIIQLKRCHQWYDTNKTILLVSKNPNDEVDLIITLSTQENTLHQ